MHGTFYTLDVSCHVCMCVCVWGCLYARVYKDGNNIYDKHIVIRSLIPPGRDWTYGSLTGLFCWFGMVWLQRY